MYDKPVLGASASCCHPERVEHEAGGLGAVDGPASDVTAEGVEHDAAEHLALAGRVLGDVGHPQLIGPLAPKRPADEIQRAMLVLADLGALGEPACRGALQAELGAGCKTTIRWIVPASACRENRRKQSRGAQRTVRCISGKRPCHRRNSGNVHR